MTGDAPIPFIRFSGRSCRAYYKGAGVFGVLLDIWLIWLDGVSSISEESLPWGVPYAPRIPVADSCTYVLNLKYVIYSLAASVSLACAIH